MNYSTDQKSLLKEIGLRLREARIANGDSQKKLGARIGVSRLIIGKMEKGDPSVSIGRWLKASDILGIMDTWSALMKKEEDPFEAYDNEQERLETLRKTRVR